MGVSDGSQRLPKILADQIWAQKSAGHDFDHVGARKWTARKARVVGCQSMLILAAIQTVRVLAVDGQNLAWQTRAPIQTRLICAWSLFLCRGEATLSLESANAPPKKWKNSDYDQIFTIFVPHDSTLCTHKTSAPPPICFSFATVSTDLCSKSVIKRDPNWQMGRGNSNKSASVNVLGIRWMHAYLFFSAAPPNKHRRLRKKLCLMLTGCF